MDPMHIVLCFHPVIQLDGSGPYHALTTRCQESFCSESLCYVVHFTSSLRLYVMDTSNFMEKGKALSHTMIKYCSLVVINLGILSATGIALYHKKPLTLTVQTVC